MMEGGGGGILKRGGGEGIRAGSHQSGRKWESGIEDGCGERGGKRSQSGFSYGISMTPWFKIYFHKLQHYGLASLWSIIIFLFSSGRHNRGHGGNWEKNDPLRIAVAACSTLAKSR
jgi:hypothetical protein